MADDNAHCDAPYRHVPFHTLPPVLRGNALPAVKHDTCCLH